MTADFEIGTLFYPAAMRGYISFTVLENFADALRAMNFNRAGNMYFFEGYALRMSADFETGTLFYTEILRGHVSFNRPENLLRYYGL